MTLAERRKEQIRTLLKGIETGDPEAAKVVNEAKYIQHNPQTQEGSEGLAALFARLAKTNPRVNVVRAFVDGDFFFGHTEYDFATRRIGFEVFRFEGEHAVEHWDNIQPRCGPNASGRSMVDGPVQSSEPELTEENRSLVKRYVEQVLIGGELELLPRYVARDLMQHNPDHGDGIEALEGMLKGDLRYEKLHRVLAEGSFVLTVCEGHRNGIHCAFYDLHRIEAGKVVEHWDTVEKVAPKSEWKNNNGKF